MQSRSSAILSVTVSVTRISFTYAQQLAVTVSNDVSFAITERFAITTTQSFPIAITINQSIPIAESIPIAGLSSRL